MTPSVYAKALMRAAEMLGGREKLRELLHVPMRALDKWLDGSEEPPLHICLKAVDVISGPLEHAPASDAVRRSRELQRKAAVVRSTALRTVEHSKELWASILADRQAGPRTLPLSLTEFLEARFEPTEGRALLEAALDAAVAATGAPMGNLQLAFPEGLRIVGVPTSDKIAGMASACAIAMKRGARFVIADVASDPIFAGKPAAAVMEQARVRAVQSTPLLSGSGALLGILSTHFDAQHVPSAQELDVIDQIARRTAVWLEGAVP